MSVIAKINVTLEDRRAHYLGMKRTRLAARRVQSRIRAAAARERAFPRSGSRGGGPTSSIVFWVNNTGLIIYEAPTFYFGIPAFRQMLEDGVEEVGEAYGAGVDKRINELEAKRDQLDRRANSILVYGALSRNPFSLASVADIYRRIRRIYILLNVLRYFFRSPVSFIGNRIWWAGRRRVGLTGGQVGHYYRRIKGRKGILFGGNNVRLPRI